MIQLNLLPDVKKEFIAAQRAKARVITISILVTFGAVGLTVLCALWVYGAQNVHKKLLSDGIAEKAAKLQSIEELDKYVTVQHQLANLSALHEKKSDFSRLLTFLPKLNPAAPNNVTITNLNLDAGTRMMMLQGETRSFGALTTFKDTLNNAKLTYTLGGQDFNEKLFESVNVDNSVLGKNSNDGTVVTFALTVVYNENAFMSGASRVNVSVPNMETTQSTRAAPNVFNRATAEPEGDR